MGFRPHYQMGAAPNRLSPESMITWYQAVKATLVVAQGSYKACPPLWKSVKNRLNFSGRVIVDWLPDTAIILGMFVLRLGVPLVITFAAGYWLRRLDAKWQAEAMARLAASQTEQANPPARIEMLRTIEPPCWVFKNCPEAVYTRCPAYQHPDRPCWLARYQFEDRLPAHCYRCKLFTPGQLTGI